MNRDGLLELRVLTGIHAGARALLLLSDAPLQLGSGDACEVILADEGVQADHASLELHEDGSIVLRWGQSDRQPVVLQAGEGFWAGPVQIAVERVDTPWREPVRMHEAQDAPPPPEPEPSAPSGEAATPSQRSPLKRLARRVTTTLSAAGAIAAVAWGLFLMPPVRALGERAATPPAPADPARGAERDPLSTAIERLGLGTRVTIDHSDLGAPIVRTRFLNEDEALALALSVSRLSPRPRVMAASDEELLAAVTSAVLDTDAGGRPPLSVRALGGSRFRVEGRVADDARRSQAMATLERAFPDAPGFDYGLTTDEEAAIAMLDELQRQSGARVTGRWIAGLLQLQAQVPAGGQARWERTLQAAAARHDVLFEVRVNTAPIPADARPSLPFSVRSAVGGATPYVVLADGRTLMPGGHHEGWSLVDIRPEAIRFENSQGQKVTLQR